MSTQRLRTQITMPWLSLALYGGLLGLLSVGLFFRLGSLLPGYSPEELAAYQASMSLSGLLDNPLNAPFLLVVRALSYITDTLLATRLAATLFGGATLVIFAVLVRKWHNTRTAIIGTLLFGISAWFLHTARMGTPEVLLFGLFMLVACGFWFKERPGWLPLTALMLGTAALLYVPGMVWFIALGIAWQWKTIDRIFKKQLPAVTLAGIGAVGALVPLGWAFYKDQSLVTRWLGLPQDWPAPLEIARNFVEVPFHFLVRNEPNPASWLGTAPIFEVFSLVMLVLGGYLYIIHFKLARTPLIFGIFAVTLLLMALGSTTVTFSVIMPFAYLIIAAGLSHLFNQWFMVFPRNPIARTSGWVLISVLVALVCAFHLTHYFIGWPHAASTHDVYTVQSDTIDK
jgi:hypothetical protein